MKIFIHDLPVFLVEYGEAEEKIAFGAVVSPDSSTNYLSLQGDILFDGFEEEAIMKWLRGMNLTKYDFQSATVRLPKGLKADHVVRYAFEIMEAAGGVVVHENKVLFISRLGKWDLPKGKLESKESPEEGALREVTEETGIQCDLQEELCKTYHSYILHDRHILKLTHWYVLEAKDISTVKPQTEENIESVDWFEPEDFNIPLSDTYQSIRDVISDYLIRARTV